MLRFPVCKDCAVIFQSGYGCTEASFMAHAYTPNLDSPDLEKLKDDRLTLVNHSEVGYHFCHPYFYHYYNYNHNITTGDPVTCI